MRTLLIFILALPQTGRIQHSKNIEESVYTNVVRIPDKPTEAGPGIGSVRYHYPTGYLAHPRCFDIRDKDLPIGPIWTKQVNEEGFTVVAPLGHEISITCRTLKAKGPLA